MKYEIWLGNEHYLFDHGTAHMDDGRTEPLGVYHSASLVRDAITIGRPSEFGFPNDPVRCYHAPGVLEFSRVDDIDFLIHNDSDHDIYIWYYAYLRPGESAEITNHSRKIHYSYLGRWEPVGLCRLVATSLEEAQELEGQYGLLVKRLCLDLDRKAKRDFGKFYTRFLLTDFLRNADADTEGLETSPGQLSFNDRRETVLRTQTGRYIYMYDKGDGNNG